MLRVSAVAEAIGIPTVSLISQGFIGTARTTALGLGMPDLATALVPGHPDVQGSEELDANIVSTTLDAVISGLTSAYSGMAVSAEPEPRGVVFEGTIDEVNRYFYENLWTDGLPIVPPTRERIEAFLAFTERDPSEVLGTMLPEKRAATIWNIAVNGAMAGCRPEYMPVLIALIEAMADPQYGVEHSGNTPGAETQIVVNGPLVKELGFNYEQGALRDGFQANTSIGRFWRLYLCNVTGFQRHQNDKATFGNTFRVAMAENEDVLKEIGWPTLAVDMGRPADENSVFISRYTGAHVIASVFGQSAEEVLPYLVDSVIKYTGWELLFTVGIATGTYKPLLILSPIIAKTIAKSGFSKSDVQRHLFENARISAHMFERYISGFTNGIPGKRSLYDLAALGKAPKMFGRSRDPDRLVPLVSRPEDFQIAVSGDPLRTNCFFLSHNGVLGFPTAKSIRLPSDWRTRLREADDS
ncbi:MAG: UGSC family (seleno)protein [Xanthobacteraceae bacterium]